MIVLHRSVMLPCGIDILMSQNVCNEVNIPGFHDKTKVRDLALLTLLLGTGIRVSECVGLDISDVDFDNLAIKVRRKGGYEDVVYFGEEVEEALLSYLDQRKHMIPMSGHEDALFLSLQNRRMAVRSVENLVKKYASLVTTTKKITPKPMEKR